VELRVTQLLLLRQKRLYIALLPVEEARVGLIRKRGSLVNLYSLTLGQEEKDGVSYHMVIPVSI